MSTKKERIERLESDMHEVRQTLVKLNSALITLNGVLHTLTSERK